MKISVIIPVYNGEKYIEKCLDSLVNQSFALKDIEVIIINDGSTDNSEKIIKKFSKKLNIVYLSQDNHGQSYTRNKGLTLAHGQYITFIDCDDFIDSNMLEKLYIEMEKGDYDIVTCSLAKVKGKEIKPIIERLNDDDIRNFILTKVGPCNMLIKMTFLIDNNFKFPEHLHKYEDIAVIPILGLKENVLIKTIDECLYYYYDNSNSVMNTTSYTSSFDDIFISMDMFLKNAQREVNYKKYAEEIEYLFIRHLIMSAGLRYARFMDPDHKINDINNYMMKNFPNWQKNKYLKAASIKYKLTAYLIKNNKLKLIRLIDKIRSKGRRENEKNSYIF